ncbi:endonuclease/exonuclease/phosphatase family protein [Cucumibacter marinus]|uniref:endonuclease/exonuclease/phosphatase family protein n=1 Tax=Cucumibacter marinus TaxID=1121252 RepID=UPI000423E875|nr:endonuclease/exonuclease/phosphatase family protein [Cucumibacter marinus]
MAKLARRFLALCSSLTTLGLALICVAALAGFAYAPFDLFNHGQLIWLPALIVATIAAGLLFQPGQARQFIVGIGLIGIAASAAIILPEAISSGPRASTAPQSSVRVMTFNINASFGPATANLAPIDDADPDILLLQEFWSSIREEIEDQLDRRFPHKLICREPIGSYLAIYSKRPIAPLDGQDCLTSTNPELRTAAIFAETTDDAGQPFAVAVTHLRWPAPVERQQGQMRELAARLASIETPVLVGGDFNSTPFSYALKRFATDARVQRQTRFLPSFPAAVASHLESFSRFIAWPIPFGVPPFLPLDHLMTRGMAVSHVTLAADSGASDHYPVYADVTLRAD